MTTTKICACCKKEKATDCFSKKRSTKDGLNPYCKDCISIKSKAYRTAHREEVQERKKASYHKSKQRADERTAEQLKAGSRICTRCGVEKPLSEFGRRGNGGFYSQCRSCVNEITTEYARINRDKVIERKRMYHKTHKEQIDAYNREYYKNHTKEARERTREWETNNPEEVRLNAIMAAHRKRSKAAGVESSYSKAKWKRCKEYFSEDGVVHCAYCGKPVKRATIDHVVSLEQGGQNDSENVVPACLKCNSAKGNKQWIEWFRNQPFYSSAREQKIKTYLNQ